MLYLNYIVYVCFLFMNVLLGCKNVSDVLLTHGSDEYWHMARMNIDTQFR